MQTATVHEMFEPDQAAMAEMVSHLFQIRCADWSSWPGQTRCRARRDTLELFTLDAIDEMTEKAAALNAERRNIYIGAALREILRRRSDGPKAEDFLAATALWADLDFLGATAKAADLCKQFQVRPTLAVITGRCPHERAQCWWRLDQPLGDAARVKPMLARIQKMLGGDAAVVDPVRIMRSGRIDRLAGQVRARSRRTQIVRSIRRRTVSSDSRRPSLVNRPQRRSSVRGFFPEGTDVVELVAKIQAGQEWDNNVLS